MAGYLCQVKADKFLTPEQWKKLEENRRIEEEKRIREKGDNWRERGLDQMMGGVLEVKKEDELKKVHFLDIFAYCLQAKIFLYTCVYGPYHWLSHFTWILIWGFPFLFFSFNSKFGHFVCIFQ